MENKVFSFEEFGIDGVEAKGWKSMEEVNGGKHFPANGAEDWVSDFGFYQEDLLEEGILFSKYQQEEEQQVSFSDHGLLDDLQFNIVSPPLQTCREEIEPKQEKQQPFSLASFELLSNYRNRFKRLNDMTCEEAGGQKLSTEEIIRLAGAKFIQSSSPTADDLSMLSHPFDLSFYGLSNEETKDVELVGFLFASAEKVGSQQYHRARKLLNECDSWSSNTWDPVRRVVYYFSKALQEKIDRETGRITSKDSGERPSFDVDEAMMSLNPTKLASHEVIPFSQVAQFAGIQAIGALAAASLKLHFLPYYRKNC